MRIYAIGDIHGHLSKLVEAHRQIELDRERTGDAAALVVHLGDLVDRGPDSKGVIDYLIEGIDAGQPWRVIKGNHDAMFADFLRNLEELPSAHNGYRYLNEGIGGLETLASYGVATKLLERKSGFAARAAAAVPEAHLAFVESLPLYYKTDALLFVHAGVQPGVALDDQSEDDLLWIREPFLLDPVSHGWLVVHGHTPVAKVEHHGNRVALDTGAAFGGPVTAAVFEDRDVFVLQNGVRLPVPTPYS